MKEDIFEIFVNGEIIYGIWHKAICGHSPNLRSKPAIIMLHGWTGYRTGPHDMLVKIARSLTQQGYDCFRFDFRGRGYSQGDCRKTNYRSMLEDLDAVLQHVIHILEFSQIVLAGFSAGAKLAICYARNGNQSVKHVIEMSSPTLRQNKVETKLSGGEIQKQPFGKFHGRMLLIHGEKDPETQPALEQIHELLQRYQIPSDTHIVENGNHNFYSIEWENGIIELISNWLEEK